MKVHIAGTRGSTPVTAPDRVVYGGDTTCLLVTGNGGEQVVLDCGTGLAGVQARLPRDDDLLILLTHFHLDHLMGLFTLPALYTPGAQLVFAAPPAGGVTVSEALDGLFRQPYWPVSLADCAAAMSFADLPVASGTEPMLARGLEIRWTPLPHPGGCTAYRIDEPTTGASLVLATDAEWDGADPALRDGFLRLCREPEPCRLLVADGQYDDAVATARRGWGHSTWSDAVALARETGCAQLLLIHHDPDQDDATLSAREHELRAEMPAASLARQGQVLDLTRKDAP